jgi:uncharacterized NAD-dependent epimerase/dehydratase family protein
LSEEKWEVTITTTGPTWWLTYDDGVIISRLSPAKAVVLAAGQVQQVGDGGGGS